MTQMYSSLRIDDEKSYKSNESELYSEWMEELNEIHGFRIIYRSMHILEEELYDNAEDYYPAIEKEIFVSGEFHNIPDNFLEAGFLFGPSTIEIFIPFRTFEKAFGKKFPVDKDQVKFHWSEQWFEVIDAGRDEADYIFNYHGYCWKIALVPLRESSDVTEEAKNIEQELGKAGVSQDIGRLFYEYE